MSWRRPTGAGVARCRDGVGSLFGPALGIWAPMAISPPTSPEPLPEEHLSPFAASELVSQLPQLESVVQTFLLAEEELFACAYVFFEHSRQPVVVSNGSRGLRLNREPVLPHVVYADSAVAGLVISSGGEEGTVFVLRDGPERVADFEVYPSSIVVVHATHSALAVRAGQLSASTRLIFGRQHYEQLRELHREVDQDAELVHLPTTELLVGTGLERVPLRGNDRDRVLWAETKSFFRSMNQTVVDGIERHNTRECLRARVREGELPNVALGCLFA